MPPELGSAIAGGLVSLIGAFVAVAVIVPPLIKRQVEINQSAQESKLRTDQQVQTAKLKAEQDARDEALATAKQEREAAAEERAMFKSLVNANIERDKNNSVQQETLVKAFTKQTEILDTMAKELRANTNTTTDGVKAIGEFSDNMGKMLEEGSKPVQALTSEVRQLQTKISELDTKQGQTSGKVDMINQSIVEIKQLQREINDMLRAYQDKLQEAKRSTGEILATNPST